MPKSLTNLQCIVLKISFCFFISFEVAAQSTFDTTAFYRHLKQEHLWRDQISLNRYLLKHNTGKALFQDTLALELSALYFQLLQPDYSALALSGISSSSSSEFSGANSRLYFSLMILNRNYEALAKKLSETRLEYTIRNEASLSLKILRHEKYRMDTVSRVNMPPAFSELIDKYEQQPYHKPFVAGAFSALVPGSGKMYLGYKLQGLTALISNVLLGWQMAESFSKDGIASPRFVYAASVFGVFYTGNIWSSVIMAKKKKRDYLNQIEHEIMDYHNSYVTRRFH